MEYSRIFNEARKTQGFKSQAHLDAFYAVMDHRDGCVECQKTGHGVWIGDGFQPTQNECAEAQRLNKISFEY